MSRVLLIVSVLLILSGCALNPCSQAICGCFKKQTFRETIIVTDVESQPTSDMTLFCEASQQLVGTTDASGTAQVRVKGISSPGCGTTANCAETTLRNSSGDVVGTVDMTQLLRGKTATVGDYNVKVVRDKSEQR